MGSELTSSKSAYEPYEAGIGNTDVSAMRALRNQNYKIIQGAVYISIQPGVFFGYAEGERLE